MKLCQKDNPVRWLVRTIFGCVVERKSLQHTCEGEEQNRRSNEDPKVKVNETYAF
jgi:hypothetical protein